MSSPLANTGASPVADQKGDVVIKQLREGQWVRFSARYAILLPFIAFLAAVSLKAPHFLTADNLLQICRQVAVAGVIACGVSFVVICGRLDLSVGSLLTLSMMLVVSLHDRIGPLGAIGVCLAVGAGVGALNGLLVGFLRLNSLIVTLGMLSVLQGLVLLYSGGNDGSIADPSKTWFEFFGRGYIFGVPAPVAFLLLVAIALGVTLRKTTFGRRVYAVGGNEIAASFSGIRSARVVAATYLISGVCVSIGAILLGSRLMGAQNNSGSGYELNVLAGVILGGTSLLGGSGGIFLSLAGVVALGLIQNALLQIGLPYYVQWIVSWGIILVAVWTDVASKRGRVFA
jgi:ribose/xylose/arabinose/galactoside ABC-type transport system permease subunit